AAGELRVVGVEVGDVGASAAVEHPHVRPAAGPGRGDDVRDAVPVEVAQGDAHPAAEGRVVGREGEPLRPGGRVEDAHERPAAGVRAEGDQAAGAGQAAVVEAVEAQANTAGGDGPAHDETPGSGNGAAIYNLITLVSP